MTGEVRTEPAVDGESVMLPGDPQMICAKKRMKDGIPLDDSTLDVLVAMSKKNNVILKLI
jgi:LDH2 family malate/lactate/ureidoglycolate dehydrogenase